MQLNYSPWHRQAQYKLFARRSSMQKKTMLNALRKKPVKVTNSFRYLQMLVTLSGMQPFQAVLVNRSYCLKVSLFGFSMSILHICTFTGCFLYYITQTFIHKDNAYMTWAVSYYSSIATTLLFSICVFVILISSLVRRSTQRKILHMIFQIDYKFKKNGVNMIGDNKSTAKFINWLCVLLVVVNSAVCISRLVIDSFDRRIMFVKFVVLTMPYFYLQVFVIYFLAFCILCKDRYDKLNSLLLQHFFKNSFGYRE